MSTRALRFHVYPRGDDGSGTPSLTFTHAHLTQVPDVGGRRVDPRAGKVQSMPYRLDLGEAGSELLTGILGDANARTTLMGRLVRAQVQTDGGSWTDLDLGPISSAGEDRPGRWSLEVSDMNWLGRRSQIFTLTTNVQVHPFGPTAAFGESRWRVAAGGYDAGITVVDTSGDAVLLAVNAMDLPRDMADALLGDVVDAEAVDISAGNSDGNFRSLRFEVTDVGGTPESPPLSLKVIQLGGESANRANLVRHVMGGVWPGDARQMSVHQFWVHWPTHGLVGSETVTGRLWFPTGGLRTSNDLPVYIGGTDGIHVGDLLLAVLDGDFGGKPVPVDSAARTAIEALDVDKVWVRADGPVERDAWLAENIYPWFLILPLSSAAGLAPKQLWTPQNLDPDTLPTLNRSNVVGLDRWEIVGRDTVNRIVGKFTRMIRDPEDGPLFDRLKAETFEASLDHDNVDDPVTGEHSLSTSLVLPATNERGVLRWLGKELFDLLGDGPTWRRLTAENITLDLQPGDLVRLDAASLKVPNASSNDRTGTRMCRVMEARWGVASTELVLLDFGPSLQPLTTPGVAIAQNGSDPDLVDVTLSSVPTGATVTVEVGWNATDVEPSEWLLRDGDLGAGTHSLRLGRSGGFAWVRAKSVQAGRLRSAWATDSVSLSARPLVEDVALRFSGATPVVSGEANADTAGIRVNYAVHRDGVEPDSLGESEDFAVAGLAAGLELDVGVSIGRRVTAEVVPYPTFSGGSVSGTPGPAVRVSSLNWVRDPRAENAVSLTESLWSRRTVIIGSDEDNTVHVLDVRLQFGALTSSVRAEFDYRTRAGQSVESADELHDVYDATGILRPEFERGNREWVVDFARLGGFLHHVADGPWKEGGMIGTITLTPYTGTGGTGEAGDPWVGTVPFFHRQGENSTLGVPEWRDSGGTPLFPSYAKIGSGLTYTADGGDGIELSASGGGSLPSPTNVDRFLQVVTGPDWAESSWALPSTGPSSDSDVLVRRSGSLTFASLIAADIPGLAASKITSGVFDAGRVGLTTAGDILYTTDGSALARLPQGTNGQVLYSRTSGVLEWDDLPPETLPTPTTAGRFLQVNGAGNAWLQSALSLPDGPGSEGQVFRANAGGHAAWAELAFSDLAAGRATFAQLPQGTALSVVGRASNSTGDLANVSASTSGHVLRRSGTALGFGTLIAASFANNTIAPGRLTNISQNQVLGRTAGGTGAVSAINTSALTGLSAAGLTTGVLDPARLATSPTDGDLWYVLSGAITRLPLGSNGQYLTVAGGNLTWGAAPGTSGFSGSRDWIDTVADEQHTVTVSGGLITAWGVGPAPS